MPRYSAVFLDADDTLFDFSASQFAALGETLQHFGLPFSEDIARVYDGINKAVWKEYELGKLSREELMHLRFERLLASLGQDIAKTDAVNALYEKLLETSSILLPGAEGFCRALAKECRLYILTNGSAAVQTKRLSLSPIRPYIARMFVSQSVGTQKPAKAFFDAVFAALRLTQHDKQNAVMVGDSLHSDILGGLNAGLDTIWFNPSGAAPDAGIFPHFTARTYDEIAKRILERCVLL